MNTTTLRGVFPDPKPVYRRNFIKENIKQVKQMQGLLQDSGLINARERDPRSDKYRTQPPKVSSNVGPNHAKSKHQITRSVSQHGRMQQSSQHMNTNQSFVPPKLNIKGKTKTSFYEEQKFTNRAMQTERTDDLARLYETGVIKYPSPNVSSKQMGKKDMRKRMDSGDRMDLADTLENLDLSDRDYIRENIKSVKQKAVKQDTSRDPTKPPPNYQKGVLPKYLRERKEDMKEMEREPECPPGHVLLPDDERKETLRVLRQSYADRIQELNSMPVRNDTLRMRKRKIEIEEELKKIDEGIKVFQRPKVFVKINA